MRKIKYCNYKSRAVGRSENPDVLKGGGGANNNVVGVICPPGLNRAWISRSDGAKGDFTDPL